MPDDAIARAFREEGPAILATLIRQVGDWTLAEDALQDAFAAAVATWPRDGVPDRPGAWITTTARRRAIDRLRRERGLADRIERLARLAEPPPEPLPDDAPSSHLEDDRLCLIFTCCHPALSLDARVALTVKSLGGLTTAETARAFLVSESTMYQRLTRARRKIATARIPYRVPPPELLPERLTGVLAVLYLIFNEGYSPATGDRAVRGELCTEAIRLSRLLVRLLPADPEAHGLLALMLLHDSRRATRVDAAGNSTSLEHQDRSRWDQGRIAEGTQALSHAFALGAGAPPGPYTLQAAIAAHHATAPTFTATDWPAIAALYTHLDALTPSAPIRNRAAALSFSGDPHSALSLIQPCCKTRRRRTRRARTPPRRGLIRPVLHPIRAENRLPAGQTQKVDLQSGFASLPGMEPTTVGRKGTLANPEVYENVPGHIIPAIAEEFDDFDNEAEKFLAGDTPENEFIGFRLKQGVYGQRQPDVQMIRVKLPFGGVTPDQMDAFATVVEKYAPLNKGHITTRQNIQIHHVPLRDAAKLIRELSDANLSSREGCGNTVRNVTGDPWAGILEGEVFDPTPYVGAYVRYFVRHPTTQLMPRKIKTAFEGTPGEDRSITGIHDIAFISKINDEGVRGFEVRVGGGTSIMPRIAPTLYDFVEADNGDYLKVAEAVFRIFDAQDWLRVNRARARIKVFVDKFGIDELRKQVDEQLEGDWVAERDFNVLARRFDVDEEAGAPAPATAAATPETDEDRAAFARFKESNVVAQRQDGFNAVEVKVYRGDLTPEQFRGLGQIMRDFSGGWARMTVGQNIVLRWVRDEQVYDVYNALKALGLGDAGAQEITDNVSCPGTDSCKLGITSSMGLNAAINRKLLEMEITDPQSRRIHIKNSGCPNGCSQHHIADIGFYGASIKAGEHTIPAYVAHIGGQYEGGAVGYGARLKVRLPAKRVPAAVERWIRMYESERESVDETFKAYADRVGTTRFEEEVKSDLAMPVEFGLETMNMFMDWDRDQPYVVQRGEGECAV